MDLYENPLAVPRYGGFRDEAAMSAFLAGGDGGMVALKESTGLENSRVIEVPEGLKWLRVAENHAPGWRFRIAGSDGWSDITTAGDKAMWIAHPSPGKPVKIEMNYQPPLVAAGLGISGATFMILAMAGAVSCFKRRGLPGKPTLPS